MPRTAFGKRQPKDELDSKKHANLNHISRIQLTSIPCNKSKYTHPTQPAIVKPRLINDPCAPAISPRE